MTAVVNNTNAVINVDIIPFNMSKVPKNLNPPKLKRTTKKEKIYENVVDVKVCKNLFESDFKHDTEYTEDTAEISDIQYNPSYDELNNISYDGYNYYFENNKTIYRFNLVDCSYGYIIGNMGPIDILTIKLENSSNFLNIRTTHGLIINKLNISLIDDIDEDTLLIVAKFFFKIIKKSKIINSFVLTDIKNGKFWNYIFNFCIDKILKNNHEYLEYVLIYTKLLIEYGFNNLDCWQRFTYIKFASFILNYTNKYRFIYNSDIVFKFIALTVKHCLIDPIDLDLCENIYLIVNENNKRDIYKKHDVIKNELNIKINNFLNIIKTNSL